MYETQISIIITAQNCNNLTNFRQCLHSVYAATEGIESDIYVINKFTEDSLISLKNEFKEIFFSSFPKNANITKIFKELLKESKGEYILILNPETIIGEESLRSLYFFLDEHTDIGALSSKIINKEGEYVLESKRTFPTPQKILYSLLSLNTLFPANPKFSDYTMPYQTAYNDQEIEILNKVFILMRHEALNKSGYLDDDSFPLDLLDIELSCKLTQCGYKNYYSSERVLCLGKDFSLKPLYESTTSFNNTLRPFLRKYYNHISSSMVLSLKLSILFHHFIKSIKKNFIFKAKTNKNRRILIISREESFEYTKKLVSQKFSNCQYINLWDLNKERITAAVSRKIQMKRFTDIIFVNPDTRYEQMILFMDLMPNKKINYHIWNSKQDLFC